MFRSLLEYAILILCFLHVKFVCFTFRFSCDLKFGTKNLHLVFENNDCYQFFSFDFFAQHLLVDMAPILILTKCLQVHHCKRRLDVATFSHESRSLASTLRLQLPVNMIDSHVSKKFFIFRVKLYDNKTLIFSRSLRCIFLYNTPKKTQNLFFLLFKVRERFELIAFFSHLSFFLISFVS